MTTDNDYYEQTFNQLERIKKTHRPNTQLDMFADPDQPLDITPKEFWYASDLHNVLGETIFPQKFVSDNNIHQQILTPHDFNAKAFPETPVVQDFKFRDMHVEPINHEYKIKYHTYQNAKDYKLSRYAAASFTRNHGYCLRGAFAHAYFLSGARCDNPTPEQIIPVADKILRINIRKTSAAQEKRLNEVLANLDANYGLFHKEIIPYFFHCDNETLKQKHKLPKSASTNDYLKTPALIARTDAIGNAIARFERTEQNNGTILRDFLYQEMTKARSQVFAQTGKTPENLFSNTSVEQAKNHLQKLETEFVKKFSTQNIR